MVCQVATEAGSDVNTAALELLDLLGKEPLDGAAIEWSMAAWLLVPRPASAA